MLEISYGLIITIHKQCRESHTGRIIIPIGLVHQWRKETGDYKTSSEGIKSKILDVYNKP